MKKIIIIATLAVFVVTSPALSAEFEITKHIIPAPAPIDEPEGYKTPDGTFNVRDMNAPFHSDKLADAMGLDAAGKHSNGSYLNLNQAIYTAYKLKGDGKPNTILVLMPGTWAGAISMDRFARDVLRMAEKHGTRGLQVWLHDRRSEQMEDHTGLWWAEQNKDRLDMDELLQGISDYYRPGHSPEQGGIELMGNRLVPLDHDAVRFMAGWGADVAIRDWRAVVLEANRKVGNKVTGDCIETARVEQTSGRVFIGGHSLGGGLTVLYAAYDFDRLPGRETLGKDDVAGLVLLEGGSPRVRKTETVSAEKYRRELQDRYEGGKVYFDMDMLGIRYAPVTMGSVSISGWAATNAPGKETIFPEYARPTVVRLPHITNEALLAFAMDDDMAPFFIARVSMGVPAGENGLGGQLRRKTSTVPGDPGECPLITPWLPGHRAMDPEFVYSWENIDTPAKNPYSGKPLHRKCTNDDPEVTDFYDFARSVWAGPPEYEEAPWLSRGPNDFPEWYFPPRLSSDSRMIGSVILDEEKNVELFNGTATDRLDLPVISFVGDDSMGEYSVPKLTEEDFAPGTLKHKQTQVHNLKGYTHLDITAATRNNQPDLKPEYENYNGCAVYAYRFMEALKNQ